MDDAAHLLLEGFDAHAYLRALIAIVKVAGVTDTERDYVESRARVLGVDSAPLWQETLTELPVLPDSVTERTRRVVLRDCVFIACIDGDYADKERAWVHRIRDWLGLAPEVSDLFEDWFRRYFDLMDEQEALLLGFEPPVGRFLDR
ncbi:MAG: hypothetical protein ABMA64_32840 [Myxococcota bacterium]